MEDEKLPWMKFYPSDFMGSGKVQFMSPAERGIYISLLCHEWQEGHLPDNPGRLARVAGATPQEMEAAWPAVRPCFSVDEGGRLYHERLESERRDAVERMERRRKMSEAGRKGAAKRWADRDGNSPPTDEGSNDGSTTRVSRVPDAQSTEPKAVDVQTDSGGKPPGASAAVDNSAEDGNRWSETVTACREHLWLADHPPDGRTIGQELSVAKQLTNRWNLDPPEVAEAVEGFARLRDRGFWEGWIERNEPAKMLALNRTPEDESGIPVVVRSLHEMRKGEPASRADSGMERLEVSA